MFLGNFHLQSFWRWPRRKSRGKSGRQTPRGKNRSVLWYPLSWNSITSQSLPLLVAGEWSGPPRSRTSHGGWSSSELWCFSFHVGAAGAYGGAWERHHHHATEAGRRLFPPRETEQWHRLQHRDGSQGATGAALHLPDAKRQGAGLQHRRGQRLHPLPHSRHSETCQHTPTTL